MSSFCTAKATHIFSAKHFSIFVYHDVNFNESLTNNVVSFEQLGPGGFSATPTKGHNFCDFLFVFLYAKSF